MEVSLWSLKAYGSRVLAIHLRTSPHDVKLGRTTVSSLLQRRPSLRRMCLQDSPPPSSSSSSSDSSGSGTGSSHDDRLSHLTLGAVEAARKGFCQSLQSLEVISSHTPSSHTGMVMLLLALGHGGMVVCPNLIRLVLPVSTKARDEALLALASALRSRNKDRGYCGLKVLVLVSEPGTPGPGVDNLGAVLSCPACDGLEEIHLDRLIMGEESKKAVGEWVGRTKAPSLRVLTTSTLPTTALMSLSSPGVAPSLHTLLLGKADAQALGHLTTAMERGQWRGLKNLRLAFSAGDAERAIESLSLGAPGLVGLVLAVGPDLAPSTGPALARAFEGWAMLEDLNLNTTRIGDGGVVALVRALEGGAPCNTTLRRLHLCFSGVRREGMKELSAALANGLLPQLEYLDLGYNYLGDDGVCCLAEAMAYRGGMNSIKEVNLEDVKLGDEGLMAVIRALCGSGEEDGSHHQDDREEGDDIHEEKACPKLEKLCLKYNHVSTAGIQHAVQALEARRDGGGSWIEVEFGVDYQQFALIR